MHSRYLFFIILILLFTYSHLKLKAILPKKLFLNWLVPFIFYILILAEQFIYRYDQTSIESKDFVSLFWISSFAMGLWGTFIIFSLVMDIFLFPKKIQHKYFSKNSKPKNPQRRLFITQGISWGALTAATTISTIGLNTCLEGPEIKSVIIPIPDLPAELDGFKIAQISDLHVGPTILKDYVDNVVKKTLALTPDMIAVTGDLIDGTPEILKNHVAPLGLLKAPHGVFYVTGNHEYYWNVDSWLSKVQELGFQSLLNENKILTIGKSKIMIAGVTDTSAENFKTEHKSNPAKAFISSEKCDYKILLAHRPDSCIEAAKAGFDLQLSGHTHAGQFFPFNLIVSFVHRYYKGLNRHENMWVYVNSGTGYWGPANRFAVPSEITLVTLKKAT